MTAELPLAPVTEATRTLRVAAAVSTSPFTGTQQVQDWGGSWWEYEISFAVSQDQEGRRLSAFLAGLRAPVGTFTFRDPFIRNPVSLGSPQVNGGAQSGTTLVTDGWTGVAMRAGDCFSLGTGSALRLYQLTADAVPAGGACTLQFVPALRSSPADNAALNVVNPGVLLRPQSAIPTQIRLADLYQFTITAREAL